jgi:hypothetical protein
MHAQEVAPDFVVARHMNTGRAPLKAAREDFPVRCGRRIDDDHLAPPQAQDLPGDGADVVHMHLLDDPTRLDVLFKSIPQSIKFIGRFSAKQRRLRQKCQLVSSTHLFTPVNLPKAWGVGWEATRLVHQRILCRALTDLGSEPGRTQQRWSRSSEQNFCVDKWSVCRG